MVEKMKKRWQERWSERGPFFSPPPDEAPASICVKFSHKVFPEIDEGFTRGLTAMRETVPSGLLRLLRETKEYERACGLK
jgi:hypothetical protein